MSLREHEKTELNERARNVLRHIIQEHVRTGKPVGSRRLSRIYPERLSPATLRNVMADLEELGYVSQPHTSAGRVPTPDGYRLYVRNLLKADRLSSQQIEQIEESLRDETDPGELMSKASRVLAACSSHMGFVLSPPLSHSVMKHIEFVRLTRQRILVILVTRTGLVQHRMVSLEEDLTQSELDQAGHYLVENFSGKSLVEIRSELIKLMSQEKALYDRILKNVILLGSAGLIRADAEESEVSDVYLGGTSTIIRNFEVAEIDRMIALFQTFEEKSRLIKIIGECLKEDETGPTVTIGLEEHIPGMKDWSLITSRYLYDHRTAGTLGILGPSRMEYAKAISLVDYVAKLFGRILTRAS